MNPGIPFRVYYKGGATYDGDPFETPVLGVLVILENSPEHGRRLVTQGDYYVWDAEASRWWAVDYPGMIQYLVEPGAKRVLLGVMVSAEEWTRAMQAAEADPDFPERTAYDAHEVRA